MGNIIMMLTELLVIMMTVTVGNSSLAPVNQTESRSHHGNFTLYKFNECVTWYEAGEFCKSKNSTLARIQNAETQQVLANWTLDIINLPTSCMQSDDKKGIWINGHNITEDSWMWLTDTLEDMTIDESIREDGSAWATMDLGMKTLEAGLAASSFFCYLSGNLTELTQKNLSWFGAQNECHGLGGRLATRKEILSAKSNSTRGEKHVYVGLYKKPWIWDSGTKPIPVIYSAWAKDQPDRKRDCMLIDAASNYEWKSYGCALLHSPDMAICEELAAETATGEWGYIIIGGSSIALVLLSLTIIVSICWANRGRTSGTRASKEQTVDPKSNNVDTGKQENRPDIVEMVETTNQTQATTSKSQAKVRFSAFPYEDVGLEKDSYCYIRDSRVLPLGQSKPFVKQDYRYSLVTKVARGKTSSENKNAYSGEGEKLNEDENSKSGGGKTSNENAQVDTKVKLGSGEDFAVVCADDAAVCDEFGYATCGNKSIAFVSPIVKPETTRTRKGGARTPGKSATLEKMRSSGARQPGKSATLGKMRSSGETADVYSVVKKVPRNLSAIDEKCVDSDDDDVMVDNINYADIDDVKHGSMDQSRQRARPPLALPDTFEDD